MIRPLMIVVLMAAAPVAQAQNCVVLCGDCNADGRVNVKDILCINDAIFDQAPPSDLDLARSDIDGDKTIGINDLQSVHEFIVRSASLSCR